jgi:MFS family permease
MADGVASTGTVAAPPLSGRAAAWALGTSISAMTLGLNIISPALPAFGRHFNIGFGLVGLMITAFGLGRVALSLPAGLLADRAGRRIVLILGPLIVAAASVAAAFATSFSAIVVWRFFQGCGSALFTTAAMTAMVDVGGRQRRGRALSMFQSAMLIGTGLGPTVGGFLTHAWGLRAPFVGYAIVATLAAAWVYAVVPEVHPGRADATHRPDARADSPPPARRIDFILVVLLAFGLFFTRAGGRTTMIPLLADSRLHIDAVHVGVILGLVALMNVAALYPAGMLVDALGRKRLIVPGLLLISGALVVLGAAPSYAVLLLGAVLLGASTGVGAPAPAAYMADINPPGRTGAALGLYRMAGDVGFLLGPMTLGFIADHVGVGAAFYVNAALLATVTLAFAFLAREYYVPREGRDATV